jgi:hypothetical protein
MSFNQIPAGPALIISRGVYIPAAGPLTNRAERGCVCKTSRSTSVRRPSWECSPDRLFAIVPAAGSQPALQRLQNAPVNRFISNPGETLPDFGKTICVSKAGGSPGTPHFIRSLPSRYAAGWAIPKGLWPKAQGCEARASLGERRLSHFPTPTGLWPSCLAPSEGPQPRWGCFPRGTGLPRVAPGGATLGWRTESLWDSGRKPCRSEFSSLV